MKKLFLILTLLLGNTALADTQASLLGDKFKLNQAQPGAMQDAKLGDKVVDKKVHVMRAVYDHSVLGGAISTVYLRDVSEPSQAAVLPKGAIVRDCIIDTITVPVSGGGSLKLGFTNATSATTSIEALKASAAYGAYTGLVACIPVGSAATAVKLAANSSVASAIVGAALTAGKYYVVISYELSDTQ